MRRTCEACGGETDDALPCCESCGIACGPVGGPGDAPEHVSLLLGETPQIQSAAGIDPGARAVETPLGSSSPCESPPVRPNASASDPSSGGCGGRALLLVASLMFVVIAASVAVAIVLRRAPDAAAPTPRSRAGQDRRPR